MDKPEKEMPNKANPEKGKPEIDIHNSDKDKVPKQYSNPNDLKNLLEDIDDYEGWAAGSNMFNSSTADRITPESPDETPKAKKITKAYKYRDSQGNWQDSNAGQTPQGTGNLPTTMELGQGGQPAMSRGVNQMGLDSGTQPGSPGIRPQPSSKMPATPPGQIQLQNQIGPGPEPKPGHHKDKALDVIHDTSKGIMDAFKSLFKGPDPGGASGATPGVEPAQPIKNVPPQRQAMLRIIAEDSKHPEKDQTGVVDSTIKDIQDDDAMASKELDELLKDSDAYMKYLGLSDF